MLPLFVFVVGYGIHHRSSKESARLGELPLPPTQNCLMMCSFSIPPPKASYQSGGTQQTRTAGVVLHRRRRALSVFNEESTAGELLIHYTLPVSEAPWVSSRKICGSWYLPLHRWFLGICLLAFAMLLHSISSQANVRVSSFPKSTRSAKIL